MKRPPLPTKPSPSAKSAELRRRAEARLRQRRKVQPAKAGVPKSKAVAPRLLHELKVHQVELEMQNAELQETRNRLETVLEKYTDLYDFAPVGYFSLDEQGRIIEVNLMGAGMLGVQRSRLLNRRLPGFLVPADRRTFLAFLKRVFVGTGEQLCEAAVLKDRAAYPASFHGTVALAAGGLRKWCRVAVSDMTSLKQVEEARRRAEELTLANRHLNEEIARRKESESALKASEQGQRRMLAESLQMQEQLRQLSRQILSAQEEERKRISRELHDVIAQTLTGINVRLAALKKSALLDAKGLDQSIALTQRLVEKSVEIVHQFARELRPAVLDDLGLIPALHSYLQQFTATTGVRTYLTAFTGVEQLDMARRTVLFRVAQEALTNVARHAKASRVDVNIQKLPDCIRMKVQDDGKSFSVESTLQANAEYGSDCLA